MLCCRGNKSKTKFESLVLDKITLSASASETVLGIIIDEKLTFNEHIKKLCKRTGQKIKNVLERLANFMTFEQKKILFNSFVKSQFNYCPFDLDVLLPYSKQPD